MPSGNTIGQAVGPVSDFVDNVGSMGAGAAFVPGLAANALAHLFFSAAVLAEVFDEGVARFRIVSGSGALAPFASVIENSTSNAMFLNGGFPPGTSTTSGSASFFREVLAGAVVN